MTSDVSTLLIGDPLRHGALCVIPLYGDAPALAYRLCADALEDGTLDVEEVDAEGSLPSLSARNRGGVHVLFIEGEELIGAKQDRIVNTSLLLPPDTDMRIPVSCVEHGRWVFRSSRQMASGAHPTTMIRSALKASVARSLEQGFHAASDQAAVWESVARLHATHGVRSATGSMADAYVQQADVIRRYSRKLAYPRGACGMAIGVGARIVAMDVFDRAETCERMWTRLLSGAVFDAINAPSDALSMREADVQNLLDATEAAPWQPVHTVGAGVEYRTLVGKAHGSELTYDGRLVHQSVVA